ncbi:hypothetical protein V9K67_08640 [Paraflavisolibacter sp. H34]|uniref:ATP-grasp domain-containing protein n=1 Tax=Huijunlia imazamoxiresistens TaxID=3127457 RepID=UPI0030161222
MKKIGILYGQERSFPMALIEKINSKGIDEVWAEPVRIHKVLQDEPTGYAVIIDRISQDVPFYRTYLKNAALTGTAVLNNPFWWSADEKFFNNCLMTELGIPVPKTAVLPSFELPADTTHDSFLNLAYPLDWDKIFRYIGFPAYMKPVAGGGEVYRLKDADDFFRKHGLTGQQTMMLQEAIHYDEYYRCFCVGGKYVHVMPFEPRNPPHQRYETSFQPGPDKLQQIEEIVLRINQYLGYDFNSVELAFRDNIPYAIDFCNPAPDADRDSIGESNFEWVVENLANYAIERALAQHEEGSNLTWGEYVRQSVKGKAPEPPKAREKISPSRKKTSRKEEKENIG